MSRFKGECRVMRADAITCARVGRRKIIGQPERAQSKHHETLRAIGGINIPLDCNESMKPDLSCYVYDLAQQGIDLHLKHNAQCQQDD